MTDPDTDAPHPPGWLNTVSLPTYVREVKHPLYRVHRTSLDPVFFGPGPGNKPYQRYDSATGLFGILYVGPGLEACLIETLLRNPHQRFVAEEQLESRSISALKTSRDLRFVDMTGSNLSKMGTTGSLHTGRYDVCQAWSDALFAHPDQPDGILYTSRHDPEEVCIALFERSDFKLEIISTSELMNEKAFVGHVLDAHGKSIAPKNR